MQSGIDIINPDTGEITTRIPDTHIARVSWAPADAQITLNVSGNAFRIGSLHASQKPEPKRESHKVFGEFANIRKGKRYTKVYHKDKPMFSNPSYRAYWFEIERATEFNTGAVIQRDISGHIHRVETIDEWADLIDAHRTTTSKFLKECRKRGYIGVFLIEEHTYWIVNPRYHWSGLKIPTAIRKLFRHSKMPTIPDSD